MAEVIALFYPRPPSPLKRPVFLNLVCTSGRLATEVANSIGHCRDGKITAIVVCPGGTLTCEGVSETTLSRLPKGHTRLPHRYLMSWGVQPYCGDYLIHLTVQHLLVEIFILGDLWERYFSRCCGKDRTIRPWCWVRCVSPQDMRYFTLRKKAGVLHRLKRNNDFVWLFLIFSIEYSDFTLSISSSSF